MSQSKFPFECDCTKKCRSRCHGGILTAAITKRSVTDAALASFLRTTCCNFIRSLDREGRTVLHMAASRGRRSLLEWLSRSMPVNPQGVSPIDTRDIESGYTALHRSIFYGQINTAVALMSLGASTSVMDSDDLSPIDHAVLDRPPRLELSKQMPCEVYTWGTNTNYNSGTGSQHQRHIPELLTTFTKKNIYIKQISLSKFHSVFVGSCGGLWSCGHGEGGRLGTCAGATCVLPTPVPLAEGCLQAAVARDHTVLLMQSGTIMTFGLNTHHQLGLIPPPPCVLAPRTIKLKLPGARGVCAGRYHSVVYGPRALYTWGLNGGHLGHAKDEERTIVAPKKVLRFGEEGSMIERVAVSNGATVAATSRGDIYLLYQFQCKKIASRLHNLKNIQVVGGEVIGGDKLTDYQKQLSILILNTVGNIYLWQDTNNQLMRCVFSMSCPAIIVMEAALTRESIMITTKHGEAFHGTIVPKKLKTNKATSPPKETEKVVVEKSQFNKFIEKDDCIVIKLKRLPNIHRAVDICGDRKGNNFAVLQVNPNSGLVELPQVTSSQLTMDMSALFEEGNESDLLHDVIIKVKNRIFIAHKYIISSGSDYFAKYCLNTKNDINGEKENRIMFESTEKLIINVENTHPEIMKRLLEYLYTGTCDLITPGPCTLLIKRESAITKDSDNSEFIIDTNDLEKSAFEVYKKEKSKKDKSNKKDKNKSKEDGNEIYYDPVRLLQEAAKRLQVTSLYKILSKYYYSDKCILMKENENRKVPAFTKLTFKRDNLSELWDTNIKCQDKHIIRAHKCILAARLDYFAGMFAHSWTENSVNSTIALPINNCLLEPIINFLYTDECPELEKSEDLDYLCNMLVISDQLFITRLREMCEVTFSKLLTLKNVPEIFQLASTYNCPQLKKCCMEYISLNLPSLLESKSLESTSTDLLHDLTEFYCSFNPVMSSRVITPFSDAISDDIVLTSANNFPIDLEDEYQEEILDDVKKDLTISGKKKNSKPRNISFTDNEKARKRNESVSSVTSLDLSSDTKNEDFTLSLSQISNSDKTKNTWVKVNTVQKKQQKIVEARLKVINKENPDILECYTETFTKLVKRDSSYENTSNVSASSPPGKSSISRNDSFGSPQTSPSSMYDFDSNLSSEYLSHSPQTTLNITVDKKLSQKQRKKLALESKDVSNLGEHLDKLNLKKSPLGNVNNTESTSETAQPLKPNPWQKIPNPPTTKTPKQKINFSDILEDERKQKENLTKMMAKPLVLTQLEDKAIEDLSRFYNANSADDERISVKRVPCYQMAAPQWIGLTRPRPSTAFKF